jgi:hypothetical protein
VVVHDQAIATDTNAKHVGKQADAAGRSRFEACRSRSPRARANSGNSDATASGAAARRLPSFRYAARRVGSSRRSLPTKYTSLQASRRMTMSEADPAED